MMVDSGKHFLASRSKHQVRGSCFSSVLILPLDDVTLAHWSLKPRTSSMPSMREMSTTVL